MAIKVLQGTPSEEEFLSEAAILSQLTHPHFVRLFGVSRMPGYAILLEYVPGGNLKTFLHRNKSFSWKARQTMAAQITSGIAHLHTRKILHCDLKSENVLLDREHRPKIADFGISKQVQTLGEMHVNNPLGTALYVEMSQQKD